MRLFSAGLICAPLASAHFLLKYPETVGFDDDNEGMAPCGGFTNFTGDGTMIQQGGFPIQLQSTHPEADFEVRGMIGTSGTNWSSINPIIHEVGLGDFCKPDFTFPAAWVGQKGMLQIIQNAVDGALYQCALVTLVSGTNTSTSGCTNGSSVTASAEASSSFASLPTATSDSGSGGNTATSASSSALAPMNTGGVWAVLGAGLVGAAALL